MMQINLPLNKRALLDVSPDSFGSESCRVLVIGSGGAGMMAALKAAEDGEVLLVTKRRLDDSNTAKAQGGIAVPVSEEDTAEEHIQDTLASGKGLCDEKVVRDIITRAPEALDILISLGTEFDRENGKLAFTKEGGHSRSRILRANGDATGAEIARALGEKVREHEAVTVRENMFLVDLIRAGDRIIGALLYDGDSRKIIRMLARAVILANGGAGQVYRETTNPKTATGDGIAAALRAGAALSDLEFMQFHPTTLYIAGSSRILISETLRGEGGILVDRNGWRFMENYSKQKELASRDVVTKAIVHHLARYGGTNVFLDMTHLNAAFLKERFPGIYRQCMSFQIDITKTPIPVHPAAHYTIGGIQAKVSGETNIEGLYACGETAATGLHGANRLGSNSLLETAVCGSETGAAASKFAAASSLFEGKADIRKDEVISHEGHLDIIDSVISMQYEMWRDAGIERSFERLNNAWGKINFWSGYVLGRTFDSPAGWELQNMLQVSLAMIKSAVTRQESRGAHFREDYPDTDNDRWNTHIVIWGE